MESTAHAMTPQDALKAETTDPGALYAVELVHRYLAAEPEPPAIVLALLRMAYHKGAVDALAKIKEDFPDLVNKHFPPMKKPPQTENGENNG